MKDQYFGDFGDYQKFSLLKCLRDVGGLKIVVHWMKTENDKSGDGSRIEYLEDPSTWESFDHEVFHFLKKQLAFNKRDLALFEASRHASEITFVKDHVLSLEKREEMLRGICKDRSSDLVFFDPDNGIAVKSTNKKNLHKFVLLNDIQTVYDCGKSVLVYQHFARENREAFVQRKLKELAQHFGAPIFAIKVKHSVFFLLAQRSHTAKLAKAIQQYANLWKSLAIVSKSGSSN